MTYLLSAYIIIVVIVLGYVIRMNRACGSKLSDIKRLGFEPTMKSRLDSSSFRLAMISTTVLLLFIALYMALIWAPNAKGEPPTYRIIYFHVSVAIMSYIGFFITFVGGILYLRSKNLRYDRWAKVGADLGIHFCMLMIISGMIWGKQRWGAWWIWEPRLTTALILMIIYVGYLILRHVLDNPATRARYAAVYGIIAFADVPLVHYAIKLWGSIMHPVIMESGKKAGLSPNMKFTLFFSEFVFLLIFVTIYMLRLRVENLDSDIALHRAREMDRE